MTGAGRHPFGRARRNYIGGPAANSSSCKEIFVSQYEKNIALLTQIAWLGAIVVLSFCGAPGFAATISRSPDIETSLVAIWSMVGSLDAARTWLAPFGIATYQTAAPA
jgi:hypothetical protein